MKIAIFGAGAWGSALAINAGNNLPGRHSVSLWARDPAQVQALQAQRENLRYLPGIKLPAAVSIELDDGGSLVSSVDDCDLVVIATPMAGLRGLLERMAACRVPLIWLCKGFEVASGLLAHEVQAEIAPGMRAGVLSGPSFALEVARGQPTALVAASVHAQVRDTLVQVFHSATLRVYANDDIVGVEVGGAVKNVLAIATGLCDGLALGLNARAALITRGLAEMSRLGLALGARAETFMGLGGLGDLVLTATGDLSRNRQVGLALARGQTVQQAVDSLGHVAEGVHCARTVLQRATSVGIEMPITEAVVALLDGKIEPAQAVALLMSRVAAAEP